MNKKGAQNNILWILIAGVVVFLLYNNGYFTAPSSGTGTSGSGAGANVPSDLQTTVTMSFKDELATSETAVDATWIAFNGEGKYFKSGTAGGTTSGQDTLTANVYSKYDVWAYSSGAYIPKKFLVETQNEPRMSVTVPLTKMSGFSSIYYEDTLGTEGNISGSSGTSDTFQILWQLNVSNAGSLAPIIIIETNDTGHGVDDITLGKDSAEGSYTEVDCPDRYSLSTAFNKAYCFKRDKMALASNGYITTPVNIVFDNDIAVGGGTNSVAYAKITLVDTDLYLKPGYTTISDVLFGAEDDSNADVGQGDPTAASCYFND